MADWTTNMPQAAQDYLEGRRLDEVECIIADLPGIARGKAVPARKFSRQDYFHLLRQKWNFRLCFVDYCHLYQK